MTRTISINAIWTAIVICLASWLSGTLRAGDYESAHRVEPGEIISADIMNELFDEIAESKRSMTVADLLGTWRGTFFSENGVSQEAPEWQAHPLLGYLFLTNVTITFSTIGNGTNQLVTSAPNPFYSTDTNSSTKYFDVTEGSLWIDGYCPFTVDWISKTRIRLSRHAVWAYQPRLATLDRQNVPPKKPKLLSADSSSKDVVLTWQDCSDDETGFLILRRDTLSGSYSNINTATSSTTCWTNTVPVSGIYWFRISATNSWGSSVGSNVKRVIVP